MGEILGQEHPMPNADIMCGVPESGLYIAEGYARVQGRHPENVIVKDRYGQGIRTFIRETQDARQSAIEGKFSVSSRVEGKKVVAADDSVIRANTSFRLQRKLREKGAKEVHLVVAAPPVRDKCDLGVDIGSRKELVAVKLENGEYIYRPNEEIAEMIGVDSIAYLSLEGLARAIGRPKETLCTHCLTSEHPIFDNKKNNPRC
jgi:amidophosphoribosyltransferase